MARNVTADRTQQIMARLAEMAERHDETAFAAELQTVDWPRRPADEIAKAVQLALIAGTHMAARRLAQDGAQRYPEHAELGKLARVLAPPRIIGRGPARPDMRANHEWMKHNSAEHRGRWVALRNGQLLTTAETFDALADQIPDPHGILLTKIF